MLDSDRLRRSMADRSLSQSELARRVGVTQTTIRKLVSGSGYGSKHLHRIARELGTTPAYLTGETDDPEEDAPSPPLLDAEARELVDRFESLAAADRRAVLQIVRSMAGAGRGPKPTLHSPKLDYRSGG